MRIIVGVLTFAVVGACSEDKPAEPSAAVKPAVSETPAGPAAPPPKPEDKPTDKVAQEDPPPPDDDAPVLGPKAPEKDDRAAGILGSGTLQQGGAFASLTGKGDISSGFDDTNIYGGLLGTEAGEMNGGFGYGRSGFGPGGGGTGWGTIGTGRYGTIGKGSGTGTGYGTNGRSGRGRSSCVPQVSIGQPSAQGDLDKAIIRRYIKRNHAKFSYCYEKELLAKPGLQGTVSTQFTISASGTVAASSASGVTADVASCVAGVIKNIEFPKPKNDSTVVVNYPFTFRPCGS